MAKICDSFGANRYTYPAQFNQRTALLAEVQSRIDELTKLVEEEKRAVMAAEYSVGAGDEAAHFAFGSPTPLIWRRMSACTRDLRVAHRR